MEPFRKEIELMRDVEASIHDVVVDTVTEFDFKILDYNRDKQLKEKGEDSQGVELGQYSNGWKRIRISRGLQVAYVDTRFTGLFHATLKLVAESDQFRIVAQVDYADDIIKKYGPNVLGLQQEYLQEIVDFYLLPNIEKMINGKFSGFRD